MAYGYCQVQGSENVEASFMQLINAKLVGWHLAYKV